MIKNKNPIQYIQREDGTWKAEKDLGHLGGHIAFADTKEEADRKLRSSLRSHAYSITKQAEGYFG